MGLVSNGWDTTLSIAESERQLNLEAMTEARIVSDERLCIASTILILTARSKVRVSFDITTAVSGGKEGGLALSTTLEPRVEAVYGEPYHEKKMTEFVGKEIGPGSEKGWGVAVRELREKLIARGVKGVRK